jgi:predicted MPP superfamily phosphohydrolase
MTRRRAIVLVLLLLFLLLGLDAFWWEPSSLVVHRERLEIPGWGSELTVAAISDLHVGSPFVGLEDLPRLVELTNAQHPDLILLLGDYMMGGTGQLVDPEPVAGVLKNLHAPLGVFTVLGNHEWWFDGKRSARAFNNAGIPVLHNEARRIEKDGKAFWVVGVADLWAGGPNVGWALKDVPDSDPVLLFTHNPDLFPQVPSRVSLTLAGHTHGGQVRLPLIGAPVVPGSLKYTAGHVVEDGKHLFVTTGVGTSLLPVRFRVPPEIALLTLVSSAR